METIALMTFCFFFIALFYSMVGFGGGSSYLVILVLFGFSYQQIPSIALTCNLIVTLGGCWHFWKAGYLKLNKVLPFMFLSIPMAYAGAHLSVAKDTFCFILGVALFAAAVRMFIPSKWFESSREVSDKQVWFLGVPLGAGLGFLSGLVGIGGGIFLSPILLFLRWANVREAAASASLFIVVNSAAGLLGHFQKGLADFSYLGPLAIAVFLGGQLGSRLGAHKLPKLRLQQLAAALVLYVSVKLLWEASCANCCRKFDRTSVFSPAQRVLFR